MTSFSIRAYQPGDEDGISALFAATFGKPLSRAHWRWKLRTLPLYGAAAASAVGAASIENEWVAVAAGQIVGHYAVMPLLFKLGDRSVLVPHGCDAMTRADFRRRGILSALGERANEVWRQAGAPFQIGFHYGGWGSVREQLGWRPVVRLVLMKCRLNPVRTWLRRMGLHSLPAAGQAASAGPESVAARGLSGIRVADVACAGAEFDELWHRISSAYTVLAVRDRAFVQWRILDCPSAEQHLLLASRGREPLGYLAYRIHRDGERTRAGLLDYFAAPGDRDTASVLLQRLRRMLAAHAVESVAALAQPATPLYRALRRGGFWPSRHGFDFSVIDYAPHDFEAGGAAWYVTGAEGDVV
jgi:hypothetical protein